MQNLLLPLRVLYKLYYLLAFSVLMILFFPFEYYLLSRPRRFPMAFRLMRIHAYLLLFSGGIILRVKGRENIPQKGAYIICSNHTSFYDAFCFYTIFRNYFVFIGKKEIEKWPLFHIYYTSGMNILVDRNTRAGALSGFRRMSQEVAKGHPLAVFPEGTRSKSAPKLSPFKPGPFAIAIQQQVPVLPVTFTTNWKRMERGGILNGRAGPGFAYVVIHKPQRTEGMTKEHIDELRLKVQGIINQPLLKYLPETIAPEKQPLQYS
jgi:1-acyl-sn-glycerol-3-phosphate acyltransferase